VAVDAVCCEPVSYFFPDLGKSTGNFRYFSPNLNVKLPQQTVIFAILPSFRKPKELITGNYQGIHRYQ